MPNTITITLSEKARRLINGGAPAVVLQAVRRAMDKTNEETIGVLREGRMGYPKGGAIHADGLRVGTNNARNSLHPSPAEIQGSSVVSAIGSNVRYVGVHEFGYQGPQRVPSHTRVIRSINGKGRVIAGRDYGFGSRNVAGPFNRQIAGRGSRARGAQTGVAFVRSHTRKANFPARAMIRKTIEERRANYVAAIETALEKDLGQ